MFPLREIVSLRLLSATVARPTGPIPNSSEELYGFARRDSNLAQTTGSFFTGSFGSWAQRTLDYAFTLPSPFASRETSSDLAKPPQPTRIIYSSGSNRAKKKINISAAVSFPFCNFPLPSPLLLPRYRDYRSLFLSPHHGMIKFSFISRDSGM